MPFVDAAGSAYYYDVTGEGEPVLFLHGGVCSAEVMRELSGMLTGYAVYAPERVGHGRTADRGGDFHYTDGVADTIAVMDALGIPSAHVVGHSDGANIGMLLALAHPDRVRSLVHVSGNLFAGDEVWRGEDDHERAMPAEQARLVEEEYGRLSPDGAEHYDDVVGRIVRMWGAEPAIAPADLAALAVPVLVMAGEIDMVAPEHTALIHRSIAGARLAIVPDASHMLVRERPDAVASLVQEFLDAAPH